MTFKNKAKIGPYINAIFEIYIYLYLAMRLGMKANIDTDKKLCDDICEKIEHLWEELKQDTKLAFTDDVSYILKDCCKQATRMYPEDELLSFDYYPNKYFEQFTSDKGIEDYFYRFSRADNYLPINQRNASAGTEFELDAYTDLYLFKYILQEELTSA